MPDTRTANRPQKRKRSVPVPISVDLDPDSDQSGDLCTRKKPKPDPQHAFSPIVNTTSAKGKARADIPVATTQLMPGDWIGLIDHILQELKETFSPAGGSLPGATETFLCELLSAILLRLYRAYSLEKLFGQGNSGPKGAVKDAIEHDHQEMSFEALTAFAGQNGYRSIETVRGNRAPAGQPSILTGEQFFDWIWSERPHALSWKHWDTADFRQQYHRIRNELDMPGPARKMRQKFEQTLAYRFFQSQTVFSYPDPNGTFASTAKPARQGGERTRKVWYHQTPLRSEEVSIEGVRRVERFNRNPVEDGEDWKPRRLPEKVQSWELVISHCKKHRLRFATY